MTVVISAHFLAGWGPPAIGRRTAAVSETSSGQTLAAAMPTGVVVGDVIVAYLAASTSATNITMTSAGWVNVFGPITLGLTTRVWALYYHVVTDIAAIPTLSFVTTATASRHTWLTQAYSGVDQITPMDVAAAPGTSDGVGDGTFNAPSLTTATAAAWLLTGAQGTTTPGTWTPPAGVTLEKTNTSGVGRGAALGAEERPTAGATGIRVWTYSDATAFGAAWSAALRPASTPEGKSGETTAGVGVSTAATGGKNASGTAATSSSISATATGARNSTEAVVVTNLLAVGDPADQASYTFGPASPTANRLLIATVMTSRTSANGGGSIPTLTGWGLTWTQMATVIQAVDGSVGSPMRYTMFVASSGTTPGSGSLTVSCGAVVQIGAGITVDSFESAAMSNGGQSAVVQSATLVSPSSVAANTDFIVTLPGAFSDVRNATYGVLGSNAGTATFTWETGYARTGFVQQANPSMAMNSIFRKENDTTLAMQSSAINRWLGIAVELAFATVVLSASGTTSINISISTTSTGVATRRGTTSRNVSISTTSTGVASRLGTTSRSVAVSVTSTGVAARQGTATRNVTVTSIVTGSGKRTGNAAAAVGVSTTAVGTALRGGSALTEISVGVTATGTAQHTGSTVAGVLVASGASGTTARDGSTINGVTVATAVSGSVVAGGGAVVNVGVSAVVVGTTARSGMTAAVVSVSDAVTGSVSRFGAVSAQSIVIAATTEGSAFRADAASSTVAVLVSAQAGNAARKGVTTTTTTVFPEAFGKVGYQGAAQTAVTVSTSGSAATSRTGAAASTAVVVQATATGLGRSSVAVTTVLVGATAAGVAEGTALSGATSTDISVSVGASGSAVRRGSAETQIETTVQGQGTASRRGEIAASVNVLSAAYGLGDRGGTAETGLEVSGAVEGTTARPGATETSISVGVSAQGGVRAESQALVEINVSSVVLGAGHRRGGAQTGTGQTTTASGVVQRRGSTQFPVSVTSSAAGVALESPTGTATVSVGIGASVAGSGHRSGDAITMTQISPVILGGPDFFGALPVLGVEVSVTGIGHLVTDLEGTTAPVDVVVTVTVRGHPRHLGILRRIAQRPIRHMRDSLPALPAGARRHTEETIRSLATLSAARPMRTTEGT